MRNSFPPHWQFSFCLQLSISFGVVQAEVQQEVRFDSGGYPNGPDYWSELNVNWTTCKTGKYQSPMRITPNIMVTDLKVGDIDADYSSEPVPASIYINEGYAVEVNLSNNSKSTVKINGVTYRPDQLHFHMGSEHKLLGHSFPMELHLVHVGVDNESVRAVNSSLTSYRRPVISREICHRSHRPTQGAEQELCQIPRLSFNATVLGGHHVDCHVVGFPNHFRAPAWHVQGCHAEEECSILTAPIQWMEVRHPHSQLDRFFED